MADGHKEALQFRGKPLVRNKNTLYYGDMSEDYVVMLQILSTKNEMNMEMAGRVMVTLMLTDPTVPLDRRIVKKAEKEGLYNALDIAAIWLKRALSEPEKK